MRECFNCGELLKDGRTVLCVECVRALETESGFTGKISQEHGAFFQLVALYFASFNSEETLEDHLSRVVREKARKYYFDDGTDRRATSALLREIERAEREAEIKRYREQLGAGVNWRVAAIRAARQTQEANVLEKAVPTGTPRGRPTLRLDRIEPDDSRERLSQLRKDAVARAPSIKVAASQKKTGKRR